MTGSGADTSDHDAALTFFREQLLGPDRVTPGWLGVDVVLDGTQAVVVFRWNNDPNPYAIRIDLDDPHGFWRYELRAVLEEELLTGLMLEERHLVAGRWEPDLSRLRGRRRTGYYTAAVPQITSERGTDEAEIVVRVRRVRRPRPAPGRGRVRGTGPGRFLRDVGFETSLIQQAADSGLLVCWCALWPSTSSPRSEAVGQAAVIRRADHPDVAEILTFDVRTDVPEDAALMLLRTCLRAAADEGIRQVETTLANRALRTVGFGNADAGQRSILRLDDLTNTAW